MPVWLCTEVEREVKCLGGIAWWGVPRGERKKFALGIIDSPLAYSLAAPILRSLSFFLSNSTYIYVVFWYDLRLLFTPFPPHPGEFAGVVGFAMFCFHPWHHHKGCLLAEEDYWVFLFFFSSFFLIGSWELELLQRYPPFFFRSFSSIL